MARVQQPTAFAGFFSSRPLNYIHHLQEEKNNLNQGVAAKSSQRLVQAFSLFSFLLEQRTNLSSEVLESSNRNSSHIEPKWGKNQKIPVCCSLKVDN